MKLSNFLRLGWLVIPIFFTLVLGFWLGLHGNSVWQSVDDHELSDVVVQSDEVEAKFDWKGNGLVTFWLDDGWLSEYENGVLYLQEKNVRGALAITTDYLLSYEAYMNWAQVKKSAYLGWEISSHSRTHDCNPAEMNSEKLYNEVVTSKQVLAEHGIQVNDYVAPCGRFTNEMVALVNEHFRSLRVTDMGINKVPLEDEQLLHSNSVSLLTTPDEISKWIKEAETDKRWLILVFHQIDYSREEWSVTPEQFRYIVDQVLASDLTVVTPNQVFSLSEDEEK